MPNRAPKLCPWCRRATTERPCPCRKAAAKESERRRGSAAARGYDSKWQMASKAYLRTHRTCRIKGPRCTQVATCVDHIVPHKRDLKLFWNRKNWQAACRECNSWKAATTEGGFGN